MRHQVRVSDKLYQSVCRVIQEGRQVVSRVANWAMVETYWRVGCLIVEDEQQGKRKAEYGKAVLADLARRLTAEYGSGYDERNLRYMRKFYLAFPIRNALRSELSWTHYRSLMHIDDPIAREWYLNECIASSWGTRALDRQIETQAYERLLATANPDRRRKRKELALTPLPDNPKSLVPADFIRNPMILEFLSLAPDVKIRETKLESALISHLRDVLMELGRGFCLEREQRPIPIGKKTFHCDLVFYNYIARCFVLIDLKVGEITPEDIGQMQLYKHYYEREMLSPGDNPPVGIVLGSERDDAVIAYTLNEHERNLFAVKYHLNLPTEEELRLELQRERAAIEEAMALRALPPPEAGKPPVPRKAPKGGKR